MFITLSYSFIDTSELSHLSSSARDRIVALQNAAAINEASAQSEGTDGKYDRSWSRWREFLGSIELGDDLFLDGIPATHQPSLFIYFAQVVRSCEFSRKRTRYLAQGMVRETLDQVAVVFTANR